MNPNVERELLLDRVEIPASPPVVARSGSLAAIDARASFVDQRDLVAVIEEEALVFGLMPHQRHRIREHRRGRPCKRPTHSELEALVAGDAGFPANATQVERMKS